MEFTRHMPVRLKAFASRLPRGGTDSLAGQKLAVVCPPITTGSVGVIDLSNINVTLYRRQDELEPWVDGEEWDNIKGKWCRAIQPGDYVRIKSSITFGYENHGRKLVFISRDAVPWHPPGGAVVNDTMTNVYSYCKIDDLEPWRDDQFYDFGRKEWVDLPKDVKPPPKSESGKPDVPPSPLAICLQCRCKLPPDESASWKTDRGELNYPYYGFCDAVCALKVAARAADFQHEADLYKSAHKHALNQVNEVFQDNYSPGKQCMLPGFLKAGDCKFEGVKKLARRYLELTGS